MATALVFAGFLSGCGTKSDIEPPPRTREQIAPPEVPSLIAVPVHADLSRLAASLEREIPRTLWRIDKPGQTCVASRKVDLGIAKVKTPKLKCRIVGAVTRGPLRFEGRGKEIRLAMPLHAVVHAEDIGGLLKRETATADAMAHANVRLDLAKDWSLKGKVDISYDWTNRPHMDFLGQRIDFTDQAEAKLAPVIARLERKLPRELDRLEVRKTVQQAWNSGFTSLSLNAENPPVWMRITPQELQYGGYAVKGHHLVLKVGLKALTQAFVGDRPVDPAPAPLPPLKPLEKNAGELAFFIPVIADYEQLEPVLMEALVKRSQRPFPVPGVGDVMATFHKATIYATSGGRIAVGLTFTAQDAGKRVGPTNGTVWMTASPINAPNSRKVRFDNLAVTGTTDMTGGDLILRLANTPGLSATLADALAQNFEDDYAELLGKIQRAIDDKREGNLLIRARVDKATTGRIRAAGNGLYLPVRATGTASITVAP